MSIDPYELDRIIQRVEVGIMSREQFKKIIEEINQKTIIKREDMDTNNRSIEAQ